MEITRQADYAVRAVLHVACLPEGRREPTSVIAKTQDIPLPFLAKIISQLAVAGIVDAMRGASGGVRLARSPSEISLLDVIQVIDGPVALNRCVAGGDGCGRETICPLSDVWVEVQEELIHRLESTTFDVLATRANEMAESQTAQVEEVA
ncbi:MAG: Rrf2 family transcriptional regulator [Anaerolineae bacterium]|nr:Rrf2 family transcriptional regulator [Anaerolineae bacterium]